MQNFEIKFSKKELDIIFMALRNSQDRLEDQLRAMKNAYWELPANEKLFWRNKSEYDKYKDNFIRDCCKQSDDAYKLEEKLNGILEKNSNN